MALIKHKRPETVWNSETMFGPGLSFAEAEAYKLLRTNIIFSFPNEGRCHVLGVTSSIQDEGKSSSSCNLAYALHEAGKKVLLLEADLRRPTIGSKLNVCRTPGLTNLLVGSGDPHALVRQCAYAPGMDIITAGDIPPNPSELLGSNRMASLMKELAREYEYIVVDLPPVTAVSDAVAISKLLDGVVIVIREGVTQRKGLEETMRQLKLAGVRVLGFVYRGEGDGAASRQRRKRRR